MAHQLLAENYLNTTITADIISATWDITITLATPPVNDKWFITISPWNQSKREVCYYNSKSWANLNVYWINRIWWKTHTAWEVVQMMDVAEWINFLSQLNASTFYPEKTWNLQVTVWGWSVLIWWTQQELNDTVLNLTDNTTNKIYFDYADNLVKTTTWSTWTNLVVYEVTTAWWAITWITPKKPLSLTWLTWATWAKWDKWDKWDTWTIATAPEWAAQTVSDNVPAPSGSTTTYNDTELWVKVTMSSWDYILYTATWNTHPYTLASWIYNYDLNNNKLSQQLLAWTYSATTHSITYSNWNIIDWTSGNATIPDSNIAYKNQINTFTQSNTFEWASIFKWLALFPYKVNADDVFLFNANNWHKQAFNISSAAPLEAHKITFQWLRSWGNYLFAVNVTWNSISMAKATPITDFTDCDSITTMYTIWWTTYPLTLAVWTHLFAAEAFSTAIHISYLWSSVAA